MFNKKQYLRKKFDELYRELGVVFAIDENQYAKIAIPGVEYVAIHEGCYVPSENVEEHKKRKYQIIHDALEKEAETNK